MQGWTEYKLREITTKIGSGSTPTGGKESYHASGITLVRSLNVYDFHFEYNNLAFIDEQQAKKLNGVRLEKNDILLNITGASVGRCTIVPEHLLPARVNQHVSIIRAHKEKAHPKFLLYCINSSFYKNSLLTIADSGATREALTKEDIENFKILLPSLLEQQRIASILSAYDELIENNNKRIALLERLAEQIYKEWFVRMRFPGYDEAEFERSIPKTWAFEKVDSVFKTSSGGTPSRQKESEYYGGDIDWIKTGELRDSFVYDSEEKITEIGLKNSSAKIFPANTLMMAMYGVNIGQLGISTKPSSTNQACCILTPRDINEYSLYYSFFYFKSIRSHLFNISMGAAQQNLSQDLIKKLDYLKPESAVLQLFDKIQKPLFEQILQLNQTINILRQTRDLLLPRLISGKLKLKELQVPEQTFSNPHALIV